MKKSIAIFLFLSFHLQGISKGDENLSCTLQECKNGYPTVNTFYSYYTNIYSGFHNDGDTISFEILADDSLIFSVGPNYNPGYLIVNKNEVQVFSASVPLYAEGISYKFSGGGLYKFKFAGIYLFFNIKITPEPEEQISSSLNPLLITTPILTAYPNPCTDYLSLYAEAPDYFTDVVVRIFDIASKVIYEYTEKNIIGQGEINLKIDCSTWPSQIYFGEFILNRRKMNFKVVKG